MSRDIIFQYTGTNKANCRECGRRMKIGEKGKQFIYSDRGYKGVIWTKKPKYCYRCLVKLCFDITDEQKITEALTIMGIIK